MTDIIKRMERVKGITVKDSTRVLSLLRKLIHAIGTDSDQTVKLLC